jgi:hypothetical protein
MVQYPLLSGSNSVVECDLAKVEVAGSNPVSRSRFSLSALPFFSLQSLGNPVHGPRCEITVVTMRRSPGRAILVRPGSAKIETLGLWNVPGRGAVPKW